jgi:hypothetical protein
MKFLLTFDNEPTMDDVTKKLEKITHAKTVLCGINVEYESHNVSIHADFKPLYGKTLPTVHGEALPAVIENSTMKVNDYINLHFKIWSEYTVGATMVERAINKNLSYYSTPFPDGVYRKIQQRELTGKFTGKRF